MVVRFTTVLHNYVISAYHH